MTLKNLIKEEVRSLLKEYFHTTQANRRVEVQEFLSVQLGRETIREFIKSPRKGRAYIREHYTEKFYWWANEDVENLFKHWR